MDPRRWLLGFAAAGFLALLLVGGDVALASTSDVGRNLGIGAWRRVDAVAASARAGRRPYDVRGSRGRTWARPRDVRDATVARRQPGRFTLGRLDGRLLASDPEAHVAVIAPTRSGKTTRCVIPWLLEHDGPAIVTSTKLDVVEATAGWRSRRGMCWGWDRSVRRALCAVVAAPRLRPQGLRDLPGSMAC